MKKHIPNSITCCNLLCGAVATAMAFEGQFTLALLFIVLGAVFDFFDGLSARALRVSSPIGKELDSLADDITFGLAPAAMLMQAIRLATENSNYSWGWCSAIVLVMAAFSALRLAKFNLDERQSTSFIGLATPANALFWASLIAAFPAMASYAMWMPIAMVLMSFVSCYLLVSEIPFFSLKFHSLAWRDNVVRYIFLIGAVVIIVLCCLLRKPLVSGALVIVWYVVAALAELIKK